MLTNVEQASVRLLTGSNHPISRCSTKYVTNDSTVNNMKTSVWVLEGRHSHSVPKCFLFVDYGGVEVKGNVKGSPEILPSRKHGIHNS